MNITSDKLIVLENLLLSFVDRVSKGNATSDTEVQVLSDVALTLANIYKL